MSQCRGVPAALSLRRTGEAVDDYHLIQPVTQDLLGSVVHFACKLADPLRLIMSTVVVAPSRTDWTDLPFPVGLCQLVKCAYDAFEDLAEDVRRLLRVISARG